MPKEDAVVLCGDSLTVVGLLLTVGLLANPLAGFGQGTEDSARDMWLTVSIQGGPSFPSGLGSPRTTTALNLSFGGTIWYSSQSGIRIGYGGDRYEDGSHSVTHATAEWVHNVVPSTAEWNVTVSVGGGVNSYCDSGAILSCGYQHELNVFNETVWTATGGVRLGRDVSQNTNIFVGSRVYRDSKGWSVPVVGGIRFAFGG